MNDRLNRKELMMPKYWKIDGRAACVLCTRNSLEDRDHLFFSCDFAKRCWDLIGMTWDLAKNVRPRFIQSISSFFLNGPAFVEIFASIAWNICKERNNFIFEAVTPTFTSWRRRTREDALLHQYRLRPE